MEGTAMNCLVIAHVCTFCIVLQPCYDNDVTLEFPVPSYYWPL